MPFKLSLAPLQGFTDSIFRSTFARHFGGVDEYYAPFLRFESDLKIKSSKLKDILPENNPDIELVPQILTNKAAEFVEMAQIIENLGYQRVNWNLGCPYPMVSKHKLGSGLLPYPETIDGILNEAFSKTKLTISVKMRLGYQKNDDIITVLPVFEKYPLSEIIIHPRIGTQIYKGNTDPDSFEKCIGMTRHPLCYNGDIDSAKTFESLHQRFPGVNHWMIGRALISNPFLAEQIKKIEVAGLKKERFADFHDTLFRKYESCLSGPTHLLNKMVFFWDYFSLAFTNSHKVNKRIKKSGSIEKYHAAVRENMRNEEII